MLCIDGHWQLVNITLCLQPSIANLRTDCCQATQNFSVTAVSKLSSTVTVVLLYSFVSLLASTLGPRAHCTAVRTSV